MNICILCKSSEKDDIQYGEFLKTKWFGVHTFCLYLSSNLPQNGDDDKGVLGFLPDDVKAEAKRISLLKCCYCYKRYANIGCCERLCRRSFHLICGIKNKADNRFCKDFGSYCHKHARKVAERPSPTETCLICFDSLCGPREKFNAIDMIMTPCCRNGWFHKVCLQRFAQTAGYFFKCPLCNDDTVFREKLPAAGIFIPNQDAAWELEPNAFAELLERPDVCAAQRCKNRRGRKVISERNPFILCHTCGSVAIHKHCLSNRGRYFNCSDCFVALDEGDSGRESVHSHGNQNDDEYIDVCHVSDKEDIEIINRLMATNSKMAENKRDSGTYNDTDISDEERLLSMKKHPQIKSSEEEKSSVDSDNKDIKPCTSKQTSRLRLVSETSATTQKSETGSSSSGKAVDSYKLKNKCEANESDKNRKDKSKLKIDELVERKSPKFFTGSDNDDSELEKLKTSQPSIDSKSQSSESSNQDEIRRPSRKRKGLHILTNSDDEMLSPQQKCFITENIKEKDQNTLHHCINFTNESDDDPDPLENFFEIMQEKKKNYIAKQSKRTLSTEYEEAETEQSDASNKFSRTEYKSNRKKFVDFEKKNSTSTTEKNLDISCIALRTRRKTFCAMSINKSTEKEQNENPSGVPCMASSSRRKTICGRTDFDKQTESRSPCMGGCEMSEVFERLHESNETIELMTDEDSRSERSVDTDLGNFIVDDGYKERDSKFELSCIANRTRRRKSLKYQRLSKIDEVSECSSDSTTSSELHYNSEIKQTPQSSPPSCSSKLDKFPIQDFNSILKTNRRKTGSSNSKHVFKYNLSNSHHPHSSNRNRI